MVSYVIINNMDNYISERAIISFKLSLASLYATAISNTKRMVKEMVFYSWMISRT
jgi:hypothetical protein